MTTAKEKVTDCKCPHCGRAISPAALLGSRRTAAKAAAARENGASGGRPRQVFVALRGGKWFVHYRRCRAGERGYAMTFDSSRYSEAEVLAQLAEMPSRFELVAEPK